MRSRHVKPASRLLDIPQYAFAALAGLSLRSPQKSWLNRTVFSAFFAQDRKILVHASGLLRPSIPYRRNYFQKTNSPCLICLTLLSNQALDGLVPVRSIHCCTYTPGLSTLSSPRRLTDLCHERSHLGVGFTLRCFQRLSSPDVATQRYAWRHNWYTIGPSTPVLSY